MEGRNVCDDHEDEGRGRGRRWCLDKENVRNWIEDEDGRWGWQVDRPEMGQEMSQRGA